ncbi:MAG: Na-translocating system protein MpsC family protein [Planctomycetota bacterium]
MDNPTLIMAQQIANAASALEQQRTGHLPNSVTVALSDDILVVTLHEALTPAEKTLAKSPAGAAQLQDYHHQLFSNSSDPLRLEINRITGRVVREAAAEVEPTTGSVVHAFTTGSMVQVFLLTRNIPTEPWSSSEPSPQS